MDQMGALLYTGYSDFTPFSTCITPRYNTIFQFEIASYLFYSDVAGLKEAETLVKAIMCRLADIGSREFDNAVGSVRYGLLEPNSNIRLSVDLSVFTFD